MAAPRVLHLIAYFEAGGIEKWLLSMLEQIDRSVCEMDFCCKLREGYLAPEARRHGAHIFTNLFTPAHLPYGRELARILQEGQYDVVHNHMETLSGYPVWIARRLGIPVISSFHNTRFPPGEQSRHSRVLTGLRSSYSRLSIGYALQRSDIVTGCSRAVLRSLAPDYAQRPHFRVLYYGVRVPPEATGEERRAFRAELGWHESVPIVLHVGRFVEQKNHAGVLQVFRKARAQVPNAKLVLVGDGPLRATMEAEIQRSGLSESVRLLGIRNDVPHIMCVSDLFLFPSRHEGFGLVATEANAAGLPVVGSAISGLDEAVCPGETALLYPPDDVDRMAGAVVQLLTDPNYARHMGTLGRKRVEAEFSLAVSARRLLELYHECLGHRQRTNDRYARR
ncbi:MAG: glycosyltransferase [Chloroherpetonaceae bacterium]|nr:glycosyltransferase [Chthonomonadaceae bacterium]MDW8206693.1 glycosyltransferase [Chloroherpetonaceae bacterium]